MQGYRYIRFGVPWAGLVLLGGLAGCGGSTRNAAGEGGSGGGLLAGGGSGSGSGSGGAQSASGQAGKGGEGAEPRLPGATADEEAILEPLFLDPAQFADASLEQLVELGARIGLARGYAMCRCATSPAQPPESVTHLLATCASDEVGMLRRFNWYPSVEQGPRTNQDLSRCLRDESRQRPELEAALRCELGRHQQDGQAWLGLCAIPHMPGDSSAWPEPAMDVCPNAEQLGEAINTCQFVGYCADGQRVAPGRCSGSRECADASDERGCFEFVGYDMAQCGDEITQPTFLCEGTCGLQTQPPLCDASLPNLFLCADGSDVSSSVVCDRKPDCNDQTDELYCLR